MMKSIGVRACAVALAIGGAAIAAPRVASASGFSGCQVQPIFAPSSLPLSNQYSVRFGGDVSCSTVEQSIEIDATLLEDSGAVIATYAVTPNSARAQSSWSWSQACASGTFASFQVDLTVTVTMTDGSYFQLVRTAGPTSINCDSLNLPPPVG